MEDAGAALDAVRPFAWLAAIAFLVGFFSYLIFGQAGTAVAKDRPQPSAVSGPASDDWNLPKHI